MRERKGRRNRGRERERKREGGREGGRGELPTLRLNGENCESRSASASLERGCGLQSSVACDARS